MTSRIRSICGSEIMNIIISPSIMNCYGTVMPCSSSSFWNAPFYTKRTPKSLRSEYLKYTSAAWCFDLRKPNVTDEETVDAVSRVSSDSTNSMILRLNTSAIEDLFREVNSVEIRSASVKNQLNTMTNSQMSRFCHRLAEKHHRPAFYIYIIFW